MPVVAPRRSCPDGVGPGHKKTPRVTGGLRDEGYSSRYVIMSEAWGSTIGETYVTPTTVPGVGWSANDRLVIWTSISAGGDP
jgi:hypothetical protein